VVNIPGGVAHWWATLKGGARFDYPIVNQPWRWLLRSVVFGCWTMFFSVNVIYFFIGAAGLLARAWAAAIQIAFEVNLYFGVLIFSFTVMGAFPGIFRPRRMTNRIARRMGAGR
jgi:hypothetical protein